MPYHVRIVVFTWTMAVFLLTVTISGANAQICFGNNACIDVQTCQNKFLDFIGACRRVSCNTDNDCGVTGRPTICILGFCQASCTSNANCGAGEVCNRNTGRNVGVCNAAPQPGPGSGNPASGAGGVCGPQEVTPGVIKIKRCKDGLNCTNNRCVRPLQ